MSNAIIIIECQPPHLGQLLAIKSCLENHDFCYIYVIDKEYVMNTDKAISILSGALKPYDNFRMFKTSIDFTSAGGLPESMVEHNPDTIYVEDKHVFTHLNGIGMPVDFLGHVKGYDPLFIRVAFRQGLAKDYMARYTKF